MMLADSHYDFGPFRLIPAARLLLREGRPVALTAKVFDLLVVLAERRGRVQTREALVAEIWGTDDNGEGSRVVDTTIKRLRRKLGAMGNAIETVRGSGYRLAVPDVDSE